MEKNARPKKHSLTLKGHRTSVSLEDPFWQAFREIAEEKDLTLNQMAAIVDAERGIQCGLASAMRLYILQHYQSKLSKISGAE
ncbi:aryl-sulfate sulfotransferase [Amylibacter marinus]|uniref:Aryl-sulfate sulfotransferase n=1 Tax=Amylibacter marinus TaxID=1475483 RepID=A0ABQ5VS37_9RHOB|nr:ribbon-helix-helix domain-containing protein [Amylibacter marinus]GLQ34087.1 aryl-sulfate sulfotransferase [Amylibacter marinus]